MRLSDFQVKDLASVSLKQPVRIFVNSNTDVAPYLRQEFIRIRPNREGDREAIVAGTTLLLLLLTLLRQYNNNRRMMGKL